MTEGTPPLPFDLVERLREIRDAEAEGPAGARLAEQKRNRLASELVPESPDPDPFALACADVLTLAEGGDQEGAAEMLRAALTPPGPRSKPLRYVSAELPEPLIRLAGTDGALLTVGEAAILSGKGGRGKSTLALQWALGAAAPMGETSGPFVPVTGFEVRRGPVVVADYENAPGIVRKVALRLLGADDPRAIPEALTLTEMRGFPLYGPQAGAHYSTEPARLPAWRPFWRDVATRLEEGRKIVGEDSGPGLLVLDPVADAFTGEDSRVTAVRSFLHAVRLEAAALGIGVLMVAHPSKQGAGAGGIGAHAVGGSPAWHDAARGVAYLRRTGEGPADDAALQLRIEKVNFGPGFGTVLALRRLRGGPFRLEGGEGGTPAASGPQAMAVEVPELSAAIPW